MPTMRLRVGAHIVLCGSASVAAIAALAAVTHSSLIFPPLGAVAYTIFAHPRSRAARPREVLLGLWLGIVVGYLIALAFGLETGDVGALEADWAHVGSASVALAVTTICMLAARVEHPPACSAALLVALGLWEPWQLAALAGGGLVLVLLGIGLNRLAGVPYPLWAAKPEPDIPHRM